MDGTDRFPPVSDHDLMTPNNDRIDIGVLGAGRMAEALVPHWVAAGHRVMIGGRTAAKTQALAEQLGASAGTLRETADFGEVILLAVLYPGIASTLQQAGAGDGALRGKVLIDCNNPVEVERFTLVTEPGGSLVRRSRGPNGTQPLDPNRFRSSR